MSKHFVLGVGAPKCGTTWLHAYLSSMPGFAAGFQKEFHIWDAVALPEAKRFKVPDGVPIVDQHQLIRREMQKYPEVYFSYFLHLLRQQGATHTADITPSYCGLSPQYLDHIYKGLSAEGVNVRVVFLMRDPVERCWSMLRMFRGDEGIQNVHPYLNFGLDDEKLLIDYALSDNAIARTRYDLTLRALEECKIPSENIYVGLYETMFKPNNLSKLSNFLRVPFRPEAANVKVHVSPKSESDLGDDVREAVAEMYRETYLDLASRVDNLEDLWPNFRFLANRSSFEGGRKFAKLGIVA